MLLKVQEKQLLYALFVVLYFWICLMQINSVLLVLWIWQMVTLFFLILKCMVFVGKWFWSEVCQNLIQMIGQLKCYFIAICVSGGIEDLGNGSKWRPQKSRWRRHLCQNYQTVILWFGDWMNHEQSTCLAGMRLIAGAEISHACANSPLSSRKVLADLWKHQSWIKELPREGVGYRTILTLLHYE